MLARMSDATDSRDEQQERRASVWEEKFGSGPPLTLGVEEEYMILDGTTMALASRIDDVLEGVAGTSIEDRVQPELMECVVEAATGVCRDIDDVRRDLTRIRRGLAAAMRPHGLRLGGSGTHAFSLAEDQRITASDRYRALVEQLQYVARRELVFGMHVHVSMPDRETCLKVMEGMLMELPILLALSVNSPFWRGKETGIASTRTSVFAGFPRSGLPPRFDSYTDYAETVLWMEDTGTIKDYTRLWWDVRPHPRLGTIEIRVVDVQFDIEHTLAITAYVQALAAELIDEIERGEPPPTHHRLLVAENKWLAARYGLDAKLMDLATGRRVTLTAEQLVQRRLRQLSPYAKELGCLDALEQIEKIVEWGTGATRQMRVFNANRDLVEVTRELADKTELVT
jgi:glutamate---cysteine ligase / carboxylate-amine ligase